jgi:hypothetical protein
MDILVFLLNESELIRIGSRATTTIEEHTSEQ